MPIKLRLEPARGMPIWKQIQEGIRRAIASEELKPGEAMPSVREAAVMWRINPATVSRAYRGLVDDALLVVRRGEGTFVSDSVAAEVGELREGELRTAAGTFVRTARALGAGEEESCRVIRRVFRERGDHS